MKREFLTLSNLLSIFRALLSVPFALVMLLPDAPLRFWAAGILLTGAATDRLDGDLARRRGEETEWGKILDPLADKICVTVMALVLLKLGDMPLWFVGAVVARDLLILAGGTYIKAKRGVVLPSNIAGKWTAALIALTIFTILLNILPGVQPVMLLVCGAGLLLSLVLYGARFVQTLNAPRS
jgi:CDP-diacylglycerol--glycerol-3-phosphate 3-phosphatidyltransferase